MSLNNNMQFLMDLVIKPPETSLGRFASNPLFDRNVIPMILKFARSMILSVSYQNVNIFGTLLFNASTDEPKRMGDPYEMTFVYTMKWSPDESMLATAYSKFITIQNLRNQRVIQTIQSQEALELAWSPDNKTLAVATYKQMVTFYDVQSGHRIRTVRVNVSHEHSRFSLSSLSWSPTASIIASTCTFGSLFFWDIETGHIIQTISNHKFYSRGMFSPDGSMFAMGNSTHIFLLNVQNGAIINYWVRRTPSEVLPSISWSPDMSFIRSFTDKQTFVSDVKTGADLYCLHYSMESNNYHVSKITWSRDASLVAIAYSSGEIIVRETKTFRIVRSFRVSSAAFIWNMSFLNF